MASPVVKIDNYVVLGSAPARWPFRSGTKPVYETFDVTKQAAAALREKTAKTPVTLTMTARGKTNKVKNLYVVAVLPGDNPYIFKVMLADCRIWWDYAVVVRRYNIRRNVGFKRLRATDVPELNPVAPQVWYAGYSLDTKEKKGNGTKPVDAKDAVQDVMKQVGTPEKETAGREMKTKFGGSLDVNSIPIEQMEILDRGQAAVARMLSYFPEVDVYIDKEGDAVIYSKVDGAEEALVAAIKPEMVGRGHVEKVDNRSVRPSKIRFYFVREIEVRYDFIETALAQTGTVSSDPMAELRRAENVLPIPDYQLAVNGQTFVQGTWITVDEALRAWGVPPGLSRLDHDLIQRCFVPGLDLFTAMEMWGLVDPNQEWSGRIGALQQHYRRTYRINRRWIDRSLSIRAHRVATIDPVRGQRAPATAWADYCTIPSQRAKFKQAFGNQDLSFASNVKCYPEDGRLGADTRPAPAKVSIADEDQGIVHLEYQIDPLRHVEMILPSMMTLNGDDGVDGNGLPTTPGPSGNMRDRTRPIAYNAVVKPNGWPKLTSTHKVAFIITQIPASPNDSRQLHKIEIDASDKEMQKLMPSAARAGLANAGGPVMEVFVGPGQETARVAWVDSKATEIEKAFGVTDGDPNLDGLVINETKPSDPDRGASLTVIARAMAARIYASMTDRIQGSMAGGMVADLVPSGWASEVVHEIDTQGTGMTSIHLPERLPELSFWSLLDGSTRAIMMRLAQVR